MTTSYTMHINRQLIAWARNYLSSVLLLEHSVQTHTSWQTSVHMGGAGIYAAHVKSAIHISTKPCKILQMWSKPHDLHSTSSSYWCYTTGL